LLGVGFYFELDVDGLTEHQGQVIEAKCAERGAWPVRLTPPRRRRFAVLGQRVTLAALSMPDADGGRDLLSDQAEVDAPTWRMDPDLLPRLADTIHILGEELAQGFALRATWAGSPVSYERLVTATDLALLVLACQLNKFTLYRVPPRARTHPARPPAEHD
jgi:hypothetical protein